MDRKRNRIYAEFRHDEPCDGLEVNTISKARFIGRKRIYMSAFDADNIAMELNGYVTICRFYVVSVLTKVRQANSCRDKVNGYKDYIKGR